MTKNDLELVTWTISHTHKQWNKNMKRAGYLSNFLFCYFFKLQDLNWHTWLHFHEYSFFWVWNENDHITQFLQTNILFKRVSRLLQVPYDHLTPLSVYLRLNIVTVALCGRHSNYRCDVADNKTICTKKKRNFFSLQVGVWIALIVISLHCEIAEEINGTHLTNSSNKNQVDKEGR